VAAASLTRLSRAWTTVWPAAVVVLALMIMRLPATGPWALAGAVVALYFWRRDVEHRLLLVNYLVGFLAFVVVRAMADDLGMSVQVDYPIAIDRAMFGAVPTVALQGHRALWKDVLATGIYLSYFLLPPTALVLCWKLWPERLPRYVRSVLLLFAAALVVHIFAPTAPPWVAAAEGRLPPVAQVAFAVFGEGNAVYEVGQGISGNMVAAMPSVHLGIATLVAFSLWTTPLRWIGVAYVPAMLWAVVYGGEHYVCDGLAGIALACACWLVSNSSRTRMWPGSRRT
jgi:PAP2 superfamily